MRSVVRKAFAASCSVKNSTDERGGRIIPTFAMISVAVGGGSLGVSESLFCVTSIGVLTPVGALGCKGVGDWSPAPAVLAAVGGEEDVSAASAVALCWAA
jgi:hypothetical protein